MNETRLPYISEVCYERKTTHGVTEIDGITNYEDARLRDKVVFRVDLISLLDDMFSQNTIKNYRALLYSFMSGNMTGTEDISNVLKALYLEDDVFKVYLGELIHFSNELSSTSPYTAILRSVFSNIRTRKETLVEEIKKCGSKYLFDSHMYSYFSVDDKRVVVSLPKNVRGEVVSYAKVWSGNFQTSG